MASSAQLAAVLSGPPDRSLRAKASRGVLWTTAQSLLNRLSGAVVFLILARLLTPEQFGLLAAALVFVALSSALAEAGLTRTLVQRPELRAAHLNSALLVNACAGLLLALALFVAAPPIAALYDMPDLVDVLRALAVLPLVNALSAVPDSILRRQLRFRSLALRSTFSVVAGGSAGVAAALMGFGVWALISQVLVQALVAFAILWSSVRWAPSLRTDREAVRDVVTFGSHVLGITLLNFLNRRAAELLIGVFIGPVALGLYTVAQRAHHIVMDLLVANVQRVALPVLSRLSEDPVRAGRAYLRATEVTTTAAFPAFALMALLGHRLVPAVFGEQWSEAGPIMAIIALAGPVQSLSYFNNTMLLAHGRSWLALRWTAFKAVTNLATFLVTVHFGVLAVAVGFTVRTWVLLPIGLWLVRRSCEVRFIEQLRVFLVPAAGAAAMVVVVLVAEAVIEGSWSYLALGVTGGAALAAFCAMLAVLRREMLRELFGALRARLKRGPQEPHRAASGSREAREIEHA